jgi:predicted SprT family Zn-dependent metalloprotease
MAETVLAVSEGETRPEEYADAKNWEEAHVDATRPPADADAKRARKAAERYAKWFLSETELLDVPWSDVRFYSDSRASKRAGVCKYKIENGRRVARVGITEHRLLRKKLVNYQQTWEDVCQTVRHELIHAHLYLHGHIAGHTARFVWLGKAHGCTNLDKYNTGRDFRFVYGCHACGGRSWQKNRTKTIRFLQTNADKLTCDTCGSGRLFVRELDANSDAEYRYGPDKGGAPGIVSRDKIADDPMFEANPSVATGSAENLMCDDCGSDVNDVREYDDTEIAWCDCGGFFEVDR